MSFIDRINPIAALGKAARASVEDSTHAVVAAVAADITKLSPELADLLSGEEVELEIKHTIKFRLKQKGEV